MASIHKRKIEVKRRRVKTPFELKVEEEIRILNKTQAMDKELAKYGRKVNAGIMWTVGDMARFFQDQKKKGRMKY